MTRPDISVVIPVFNRGQLIRYTLESVQAASTGIAVETIIIDDGSNTPVADDINQLNLNISRVIRQENQGLLYARLAGLKAATGRNILFLDSDDLISKDKLRSHVQSLNEGLDVTYTDQTSQTFAKDSGPEGAPAPYEALPETQSSAFFFISVQPAPHSPAFRTDYLREQVKQASFAPSSLYNPVAEIWFYHICASHSARVGKCAGLALVGEHQSARLTNHWERLAVASLAVQEAFARHTPADTAAAQAAHVCFAAKAFQSWRRLPRNFSPEFSQRQLSLYRTSHIKPPHDQLGGRVFSSVATLLGPILAGKLFRLRNDPYESCRTITDDVLTQLINRLPPAL